MIELRCVFTAKDKMYFYDKCQNRKTSNSVGGEENSHCLILVLPEPLMIYFLSEYEQIHNFCIVDLCVLSVSINYSVFLELRRHTWLIRFIRLHNKTTING